MLFLCDRGRGLECCPECQGHSVGNASQNAAAVICNGYSPYRFSTVKASLFSLPRSAAAAKARAELNALYGGDSEYNGGNFSLHSVEQGAAQSHGQASTAHSMMPPTESPSALAAAMAARMASPRRPPPRGRAFLCRWRRSAGLVSRHAADGGDTLITVMPRRRRS